ncbi:1-phosphofructokinase family hexose kinase [Edaphobacter flagellatus]|uniref:hypothetical protein n=1 Tax=Edaphobacter flagellatus TaxID=1933044 RepID=UPI0021B298CC|nr:hypothetical protein [Edaphobacter flagellatus]
MPGEEITPEELEALAREMEERALDERIVVALESAPDLSISADFAARVAEKVPVKRVPTVAATHYGLKVMWAALAALLVVLAVLAAAHGSERSVVGEVIEWVLVAQFLSLAIWLGLHRRSVD